MIVQAPDNKTIDFGDLPPDQVQAAMQKMYPPTQGTSSYQPSAQDYLQEAGQGATFGLNDEIGSGLAAGYNALQKGTLGDLSSDYNAGLEGVRGQQKQLEQADPAGAFAAQLAGGLATSGGLGATKAGATLANSLRSGNLAARVAKGAATGAASGAAYGFGTGEGDLQQRLGSAGNSALVGGTLGGAIPAAGAAIGGTAKAIGNIASPELEKSTAELAKRAQDFGIPLRLDQIDPSRIRQTVQKVSQEMPFSGVGAFDKKQASAFNKAVANTLGQDSDNLGPNTIQAFRKDNSDAFNNAFTGQQFTFDDTFTGSIKALTDDAKSTIDEGLAKVVKENVDNVISQIGSGNISGEKLGSIRSELLKKMTRIKNSAAPYVSDIIEKIDDLAAAQMPADKTKALAQARYNYRNFKTVQPLLEKSTDGNINPTQLINRVAANKYIDASKIPVGEDDLVDLARIGKQFMPQLGGSDTMQKTLLGGGGVLAVTNPVLAAKAALGLGANRAFQSSINQSQKNIGKSIDKSLRPYSSQINSTTKKMLPK